ncbi:MAG: diaminopimelate epimerase [bacterium]
MPETLSFVKVEGLGNDFVLLDLLKNSSGKSPGEFPSLVRTLCDRHFGVGADGILLLLTSEAADFRMRIFNSDGSEAQMCGNGIRCLTGYIYKEKLTDKKVLTIETLAGLKEVRIVSSSPVPEVEVNMGVPALLELNEDYSWKSIPLNEADDHPHEIVFEAEGLPSFAGTAVSIGNPHFVLFVDSLDDIPLGTWGPAVEKHPLFPEGTNVEFCAVEEGKIRLMVWERGAGETLACGTGACAAFAAASIRGLTGREAEVVLPGGSLFIHLLDDGSLLMRGPAREVFRGDFLL